jgi:hypothetical protein
MAVIHTISLSLLINYHFHNKEANNKSLSELVSPAYPQQVGRASCGEVFVILKLMDLLSH